MKIFNKKAKFDYQLDEDRIEAGISLRGLEAKTLREGRGDISQSFIKIVSGEAFLINANIPTGNEKVDQTRSRKLLLHKREILSILTKAKARGLQIVPLKLYNKGPLIKLELTLGKSKKKFEKKQSIKKHDIEREAEQELRGDKE